jgi:hypothetical protein
MPSPSSAAVDRQAFSQAAALCSIEPVSRCDTAGWHTTEHRLPQGSHLCVAVPVGHHGRLTQDLLLRAACRVKRTPFSHCLQRLAVATVMHNPQAVSTCDQGRDAQLVGRDEPGTHHSSRSPSARRPPRACRPLSWRCTAAPGVTMTSEPLQFRRQAMSSPAAIVPGHSMPSCYTGLASNTSASMVTRSPHAA